MSVQESDDEVELPACELIVINDSKHHAKPTHSGVSSATIQVGHLPLCLRDHASLFRVVDFDLTYPFKPDDFVSTGDSGRRKQGVDIVFTKLAAFLSAAAFNSAIAGRNIASSKVLGIITTFSPAEHFEMSAAA